MVSYPIILKRDKNFFVVYVPDFDLYTQGENFSDAMDMARDLIKTAVCHMQETGQVIPKPSKREDITPTENNSHVLLVNAYFDDAVETPTDKT